MPAKVVDAVAEFVYGPLAEAPLRMGKPLKDDLEGLMSARRGSYRILYRVDEASQTIVVVRIAHRSHAIALGDGVTRAARCCAS